MKKIIRISAALTAAALALLAPTVASAASGGTDRPYNASGVLTGVIDESFNYVLDGPTVGTHYGKGPTSVVGNFIPGTQTFTVTAANGDTILGALVGPGAPVDIQCPAGWDTFSDLDRFTGGTGRFASASGTIRIWGCSHIDFATGAFTASFTASGTISY
jgi:hypothetical protein